MIFVAQINPMQQHLVQGMGFSTPDMAQTHFDAHPEFLFVSTLEFVSPMTHAYVDGQVVRL